MSRVAGIAVPGCPHVTYSRCMLGRDGFLSKLERTFGRRPRALPVGHPRGKSNSPK